MTTEQKSGRSVKKPVRKRTKNSIVKSPKKIDEKARLRQKPQYKSFRLHKSVKHPEPRVLSVASITKKTFRLMWANKKNMLFFILVYGLLYLLLVRGLFSPINIDDLRFEIESATGSGDNFSANTTVFGRLVGSLTVGVTGQQGVYQVLLVVISALAMIWLYRQQQVGNTVSVRQAFYRGMYPLVPFLLIIGVMILQLLPAIIGNFMYSVSVGGGIAVGSVERFIWLLLYLSLLLFSFYLISSSVIGLLVVTLPEMTPMRALRKAKELVRFRRFSVFVRFASLILIIGLCFIAIIFPSLYLPALVTHVLFLLVSILALPFIVGYLFVLYRELL